MGDYEIQQCVEVEVPPSKSFLHSLKSSLKETFFPDDPFRHLKNQTCSRKFLLALQYFVPIFEWAPRYSFLFFRGDFVAGITIASLAVPQGISYAGLASLPPIIGLYSSFVPPLLYAMLGSSRDLAVGTVAIASLLMLSMIGKEVNPHQNPHLYLQLVLTATFVVGVLQSTLGLLRLGFIVDLVSHATLVGYMGGAATVVCLQQFKAILGLQHITHRTDIISTMESIFTQVHMWRWETMVLGFCFIAFLFTTKWLSGKRPVFFWINVLAPLASVILGSLMVYLTHADKHGVKIIGQLKQGVNPPSISELKSGFGSPYLWIAIKTGVVAGVIALVEGIAVGRSFAILKNYHIDGNKEMIAFGVMNIVGSCTSCYLTTGSFSRTAVNFNAGCKSTVSNIVMAIAVMIALLFLTPIFYYTPLVVLSAIILTALAGLIDYEAAIHLWAIDKYDFIVCISAYLGVVFSSVETGLIIAVAISLLRILLFVARPKTFVLGSFPNSTIYRSIDQYPKANSVPGIIILHINTPIYFANASYLRERISRWIADEENKLQHSSKDDLQYVILDMSAVGSIDTSGIRMLEEVKKNADDRSVKLALANPGGEVMKKLAKSKFIDNIGKEWIFHTVGEAVHTCNFILQTCGSKTKAVKSEAGDDKV